MFGVQVEWSHRFQGAPVYVTEADQEWVQRNDPAVRLWDEPVEVLPGVTRSFASLSAAAEEAGLSRIFAGVHVRDDHTAGARLGRDVAEFVAAHFLRAPVRGLASGG